MTRTMQEYAIEGFAQNIRRLHGATRAGLKRRKIDVDVARKKAFQGIEDLLHDVPSWVPDATVESLRAELTTKTYQTF